MIEARIRQRFEATPGSQPFELDLKLAAAPGITVLFGPSGAGKTLTLESIAGFLRPSEGRILLDGRILFDAASGVHLPPRLRQCGYVFQNYALFPHMSLRKNLEFAAERLPRLEKHRKVAAIIERFQLAAVSSRMPHELSGGQRQRASIARALLASPKMLLLDEPARGLDAPLRSGLYSLLREIHAEFPLPILLVTHDLEEACALASFMYVLHEGRIVQSGAPAEIVQRPATLDVLRLLGVHVAFEAEIRSLDPASSTLLIDGRDIAGPYFPGRFRHDRLWVYLHPARVRAVPASPSHTQPNRIPVTLTGSYESATGVHLDFAGGWKASVPPGRFAAAAGSRDWLLEIDPDAWNAL
jgi:molybdate transport system ATP-binding protein